jgi:purine-binding chemotaxis protein CheW
MTIMPKPNEISSAPGVSSPTRRCCTFLVAGRCFAVDADLVAEVLQSTRLNMVPLAAPAIAGLLNLRGRIVPVIDLHIRLGFPPAPPELQRINLIVDLEHEWYSLLVDNLLDVVTFDVSRIEQPTGERTNPSLDAVTGVLADRDLLVHFLAPDQILQSLVITRARGLSVG